MPLRHIDTHATLKPPPQRVELRGASGRLYGYLDPQRLVIEVKRKNEPAEEIDLKKILTGK